MPEAITIRQAGSGDADEIAALHAASWQAAYRGILSDAYLDGPVFDERRAFWRKRLAEDTQIMAFLAEVDGLPGGFIAWVPDSDPHWGGIIDNFHMSPALKGKGIGRRLFDVVRRRAAADRPGQALFLWVLEANAPARQAYGRLGGTEADRMIRTGGDGSSVPAVRVIWPAPVATSPREI